METRNKSRLKRVVKSRLKRIVQGLAVGVGLAGLVATSSGCVCREKYEARVFGRIVGDLIGQFIPQKQDTKFYIKRSKNPDSREFLHYNTPIYGDVSREWCIKNEHGELVYGPFKKDDTYPSKDTLAIDHDFTGYPRIPRAEKYIMVIENEDGKITEIPEKVDN